MENPKSNKGKAWYTGDHSFPNVIIPEKDRDDDFYKAAIDYAVQRFRSRSTTRDKITKLHNSYNGNHHIPMSTLINETYGTPYHAKYRDFNISRRKADQLLGEFVDAPLNGSVMVINREAITKKNRNRDIIAGLRVAAPYLKKIREEKLANPFEGFQPPEQSLQKPQSTFAKMTDKTKNEYIMQMFAKEMIQYKNIKDQFFFNMTDAVIASEMFGKVELDEYGDVEYRFIDTRRRMAEEIEGDIFLKKSPYMGEHRMMYVHEVLEQWPEDFANDPTLLRKLKDLEGAHHENIENKDDAGSMMVDTYTIEFFMYDHYYFRDFDLKDDSGERGYKQVSSEWVNNPRNKNRIKKAVRRGEYKLDKKIKKVLGTVTRIGEDIYVGKGEVPFIMGSKEKPFETEYNYVSMVINTHNNYRTSVFEALEEIKFQYNLCRMIINRELFKSKGMAVGYDRKYLPKASGTNEPMSMNKVLSQIVNDAWIDFTTANDINIADPENASPNHLKVVDIGMSKMVPQVVAMAYDLERLSDDVSGINKARQGSTPASSTATNANNNLQQSRSSTAPLFYFANRFFQEVMRKCIERRKVGIAYIKADNKSGECIVGHEAIGYIRANKDIADDDYGYFITDGRKEMDLRQTIRTYIPQAIAAKELRIQDAVKIELQETFSEVYTTLDDGWNKIQEIAKQSQDAQMQQMIQQAQMQKDAMREDREDKQLHEASLKVLDGEMEAGLQGQEAINQYNLNNQQAAQEATMQQMEQQI